MPRNGTRLALDSRRFRRRCKSSSNSGNRNSYYKQYSSRRWQGHAQCQRQSHRAISIREIDEAGWCRGTDHWGVFKYWGAKIFHLCSIAGKRARSNEADFTENPNNAKRVQAMVVQLFVVNSKDFNYKFSELTELTELTEQLTNNNNDSRVCWRQRPL